MRRNRVGTLSVGLLLLSGVLGCGMTTADDSNSEKDTKDSGERIAASSEGGGKVTVKLLKPGAEPRTKLRYEFQADQSEKMVMEMSMAMSMTLNGTARPEVRVPTSRMTMTIDAKEITAEGNLRYEFELKQAEVLPLRGADRAMVSAMKKALNSAKGLSGSATVSTRGFTNDVKINIPAGIDPNIKQFMDGMKQSMNQMSAPLPEEPVGKGGSWKVTMPMEANGMKFTQIATYTLAEIQGDKVKFDIDITQSARPQEFHPPGVPPGTKVMLESLKSSGTATVDQRLTNLTPTSTVEITTTNVVSANGETAKTKMRIGMKIHP